MFQFIFGSLLVISIIGWPFFDTLFEANKNSKKYSRKKYRIEYYVIDCVKEFYRENKVEVRKLREAVESLEQGGNSDLIDF